MDNKRGWKSFQKLKLDRASIASRAKKAETATTRHAHKFVIQKLATIRDIRQHITIWLMVIGVLIAATAIQMIWFHNSYTKNAPVAGGIYAEATLGPIETLNPLYASSSAERSASQLLFSGLYDYDRTGHLRDDLASSIDIAKDQRHYTVSLRKDALWHDGQPVTAADVIFTVNTMKNPDVRAVMRQSWLDVTVKQIDMHTVEFTLPTAHAAFPHALTFAVLPKHILESVQPGSMRENVFSVSPVGSGPFSLRLLQSSNARESHKIAHLVAWNEYYRGAPKLSRFELHAYSTPEAIARAVKTRDVNAAIDVNTVADKLPRNMLTESYPINAAVYALFNTSTGPLSNKSVRQALQAGTDRKKLQMAVGNNVPALNGPFLKGQIETVALPAAPAYNTKKAEQLLTKAGWKRTSEDSVRTNRHKQPLTLELKVLKGQYSQAVSSLTDQWRRLGIDVKVVELDVSASDQSYVRSVLQPRAYDVLVTKLDIGSDPDIFAYWHSSQANSTGLNFSNYKDAISDDALLSARLRSEKDLREQKYRTFTKQWYADAPAIGLYQAVDVYTHSKTTKSLVPGQVMPSSDDRYADVIYWTAEMGQVYKTP
jgi:peptide/nickel transport system substrate-binding protein